mgnify:CR=1 FL=1
MAHEDWTMVSLPGLTRTGIHRREDLEPSPFASDDPTVQRHIHEADEGSGSEEPSDTEEDPEWSGTMTWVTVDTDGNTVRRDGGTGDDDAEGAGDDGDDDDDDDDDESRSTSAWSITKTVKMNTVACRTFALT